MNIYDILLAIWLILCVLIAYWYYRKWKNFELVTITVDDYRHYERRYREIEPKPPCTLEQYISEEIGTRYWEIKDVNIH